MTYDEKYEVHRKREERLKSSRKEMGAIVDLAGFTVSRVWELANLYWPLHPDYDEVREPWWLFMTELGPIQIGWRKRVINIRWDATRSRVVVTADDVTKGDDMVHAYSVEKAVEYLKTLRGATPAPPVVVRRFDGGDQG